MLNINTNFNRAYNLLPYYLILAGIYNIIFKFFGITYIYVYIYVIGTIWSLFKKHSKYSYIDILAALYLFLTLISTFIAVIINQNNIFAQFISSLIFVLPFVFWLLYYKATIDFDFDNLIYSLKWHVFIVALLGLIQYYLSPNLFGIIESDSNNILWALENVNYKLFFRATSILGSPQVYGAFISLFIVLFILAANKKQKNLSILDILYLLFLFIAGAHSGNKSFFAVLGIYFIYVLYKKKIFIISAAILSLAVIFASKYKETLFFLQRIFFNEDLIEDETGRIDIWKNALLSFKFFGDGPGSWSNSSFNRGNDVAESYFLQVLAELGIFAFIIFVLFLAFNLFKIRNTNLVISFITCMFIMFIVHVFNSPAFILFWGVCLYGTYNNLENEKI